MHYAKSETHLTFDFRPKARIFISGGGEFEPLPPDFKVWMVKIWKNKAWAEISARCQVRNTPYFWFSVKNTEFHLWGWWVQTPPDLKVWMAKNWKTKVWAEISAQCQVRNTPYFWFSAKNKDFQFLEVVGSNPPWQVGLKMQKSSNLASQQWSTLPRIILTKFHQNRPKIAPVTEKSTLLTDLALAPLKKHFQEDLINFWPPKLTLKTENVWFL